MTSIYKWRKCWLKKKLLENCDHKTPDCLLIVQISILLRAITEIMGAKNVGKGKKVGEDSDEQTT